MYFEYVFSLYVLKHVCWGSMRFQNFSAVSMKNNTVNNRFAVTVCMLYGSKLRFEASFSVGEVCWGRIVTLLVNKNGEAEKPDLGLVIVNVEASII